MDIGPAASGVRPPIDGMPMKVARLVRAVNGALGRLNQGFVAQRQFTANATYELSTPLAIITACPSVIDARPVQDRARAGLGPY
jgi:signal transduction histidine kinase